ncbi:MULTISPECIES: hypothetical protein [unclassified Pseudofrankia]|uniref:hypothetical protein n=1 Tax=unclassified Pseudofrankia TaxID=2994372 RepID=UPI0012FFAED9|nr:MULTISPECIES: hypothetical protein [unclassified Pseudofrankia]MDT3444263.1 hypothetical protein [Pseudofrankia sp. BMG5.37]
MLSNGKTHPPSANLDLLAALQKQYTEIIASLDRDAAIRRVVTTVPPRDDIARPLAGR